MFKIFWIFGCFHIFNSLFHQHSDGNGPFSDCWNSASLLQLRRKFALGVHHFGYHFPYSELQRQTKPDLIVSCPCIFHSVNLQFTFIPLVKSFPALSISSSATIP